MPRATPGLERELLCSSVSVPQHRGLTNMRTAHACAREGQDRWRNPRQRSLVMFTRLADFALPILVGREARQQEARDTCDGNE
jgi:hypothetical protein